ncbi:helicase-related protein [Dyadobacter sp.]|uniref:helicase-related protein n=1 Tax=Dyadobacter sp. TaxID=1914288 RepID=UPI003F722503
MDRIQETATVVIGLHKYQKDLIKDYELIRLVCDYFDSIKKEYISRSDLRFLRYLANTIGIPHFYELLEKFNVKIDLEEYDLNTISSLLYESTLHTDEDSKVHKYQKQVLDLFEFGKLNRFFLSASTSFGKTHIVYEIIKKMQYKNIALIFPTVALLTENVEKISTSTNFKYFREKYFIHTLSDIETFGENNIFIYTPERFLSFLEKQNNKVNLDFAFVDEVYKIDNEYLLDDEIKENERDVAYRLAVFYTLQGNTDILFAGPYIDFSASSDTNYNKSFDTFLESNKIELINYNNYEIVNKTFNDIKTKKKVKIDNTLSFNFTANDKSTRLFEIITSLKLINENTIIYCSTRASTESYAKKIITAGILKDHNNSEYSSFISHVQEKFGQDWVMVSSLINGIGIHHGLIPKYIQKEIISLFNRGKLRVLLSTTTITEGVNTSAKNLVVLHSKKGSKNLKKFDAKNIAGRAGRFLHHYSGRVIVLQNEFMSAINSSPEGIKHKNFDIQSPKDEIDLFYTEDLYLSDGDRKKKIDIQLQQSVRNIPDEILDQFKVISRVDKLTIFDRISTLSTTEFEAINALIRKINSVLDIDYDGFQLVLNIIEPIVRNKNVKFLIENGREVREYSTLTHLVHFYLQGGFIGSVNYRVQQGDHIDVAIRSTADFIYNTLKYQVVKYLGVFNVMYKFYISSNSNNSFEDTIGIDRLIVKLEYNALSEEGKIASDFGVPSSIIDYYENQRNSTNIRAGFDAYEATVFERIDAIINKKE